jgi:V/A-type H+-transporting ATPase subunit E
MDGQAMTSVEEGIQGLSRAVLAEARTEAERLLADARTKVEAIHQQAQEQAEAEGREILERARAEAASIRSQCIAAAELEARTQRLERREKLLDSVFDAVQQRLPAVQQWTDYSRIVRQLAEEAVAHLGASSIRIRGDERAQAILEDGVLAEIASQAKAELQLGERLQKGTGVVAETADGHRRYDNTLEARLSRLRTALRAPVFHLLMGESL